MVDLFTWLARHPESFANPADPYKIIVLWFRGNDVAGGKGRHLGLYGAVKEAGGDKYPDTPIAYCPQIASLQGPQQSLAHDFKSLLHHPCY